MRIQSALAAAALMVLAVTAGALAQSDRDVAQMQLYIQQLEEQVRLLTGENERLLHELRQSQAQAGQGNVVTGSAPPADAGGSGTTDGEIGGATMGPVAEGSDQLGAPPRDLGTLIITEGGDAVAAGGHATSPTFGEPQAATAEPAADSTAPVDLSALAGGVASLSEPPDAPQGSDLAAAPQVASLPAGSRQAYDVAYGYVLTGDYDLAEQQFRAWLETFPGDPQATDAAFWLGESQFQQGKHREAANTLLALYREAPNSRKAPDALMKLGMALAALGEQSAACSTFGEIAKRHPDAPASVTTRAAAEADRAGC